MLRVTLITIGTCTSPDAKKYVERLQREVQWELVELPDSKERDPQRQQDDESQRLLAALEKRIGQVWVLDERGKQFTSPVFAQALQVNQDRGDNIIFVIGGAHGLTNAVRERADVLLALSSMVLPHDLCRVVFLEQLYRAQQINRGTGYHH